MVCKSKTYPQACYKTTTRRWLDYYYLSKSIDTVHVLLFLFLFKTSINILMILIAYQNYKLDKVCNNKIIIHPTFLITYISSVNNIVITPNIN